MQLTSLNTSSFKQVLGWASLPFSFKKKKKKISDKFFLYSTKRFFLFDPFLTLYKELNPLRCRKESRLLRQRNGILHFKTVFEKKKKKTRKLFPLEAVTCVTRRKYRPRMMEPPDQGERGEVSPPNRLPKPSTSPEARLLIDTCRGLRHVAQFPMSGIPRFGGFHPCVTPPSDLP